MPTLEHAGQIFLCGDEEDFKLFEEYKQAKGEFDEQRQIFMLRMWIVFH